MPSFDSFKFFEDLLPALLIVAPLLALARPGLARRAMMIALGLYLLFLIAPRLALFHLAFWLLAAMLQQVCARSSGTKRETPVLWLGVVALLAPMLVWKLRPVGFVVQFNLLTNETLRHTST